MSCMAAHLDSADANGVLTDVQIFLACISAALW